MKKLLSLFAVLSLGVAVFASSASAIGGSKLKTVSPGWGTWTPQGFVASTDTTFINGAVAQADTTGPIDLSDCDWRPFPNFDPNAASLAALKVFFGGTLISYDTAFVAVEFSMTAAPFSVISFVGDPSGTFAAMTQLGAGGGTQQLFATPIHLSAAAHSRGGIDPFPTSATTGVPFPAPFARIIVKSDGNTAARASGAKVHLSYHHTDGGDGHAPRFEWKQVRWGTYGSNGIVSSSLKDTSSVTFSAPDTTEWFDLSQAVLGPALNSSTASGDTTSCGAYLMISATSDPSSNDSLYVQVDGSPNGFRFNTTPLTGTAGGFLAGVPGSQGDGVGTTFGLSAHAITALSAGPGALASTPFVRFRIRGGHGGEVVGGAKVWVGYWKNPYND